ncbi:TPA: helix-turn-helix domain-containing protein, partial [Streptococcus suis]
MESNNFDYKKLKAILKAENISEVQFSRMTGKSLKTVRSWLKGTTVPYKNSLSIIISVLHISEEAIKKDGIAMSQMEYKVIMETLDYLLDIYMPFFAYYKRNNEGYQISKKVDHMNKINKLYDNNLVYGINSSDSEFTKKVTLDNKLIEIVTEIENYVTRPDFPIEEMKETSLNMIKELAIIKIRENNVDIEQYENYRNVCIASIKKIDEIIKKSTMLQRMLGENIIVGDQHNFYVDRKTLEKK